MGAMYCARCGEPLRFEPDRLGWVHAEGSAYMMACPDCGWTGARYPSPVRCPKCGSRRVRDDHCVLLREY